MQKETRKKLIQAVMIVVAAGLNIWGILSLLQTLGTDVGLKYFEAFPNLVLNYVVVIATMACGIMLMSAAAGTFKGKVKNVFSIAVCAYSTVMTVPLLLAFILMIPVAAGASMPEFLDSMVGDIVIAFQIFLGEGGHRQRDRHPESAEREKESGIMCNAKCIMHNAKCIMLNDRSKARRHGALPCFQKFSIRGTVEAA